MSFFHKIIGKIQRSPRTIKNLLHPYHAKMRHCLIYSRCYLRKHIDVLFLVEYENNCKWDKVYELMRSDSRFNAKIIACPRMDCEEYIRIEQQQRCYDFFKSKGYDICKAYNPETNSFLNLRDYHPDVIFYTNPYNWISYPFYYLPALDDVLSCYISYNFNNAARPEFCNLDFHKHLWRYYMENNENMQCYSLLCGEKRSSFVVTGYPSFDRCAKRGHAGKKVIIWAPHHTLKLNFGFLHRASFLNYYEFMLQMAAKYQEDAYFIFRPHPILKERLYGWEGWGKENTDAYYNRWNNLSNGRYSNDDDYIELFESSDGMMHDCASFAIEYLYVEKPVLFLGEKPDMKNYTVTAAQAYECHEYGFTKDDVENFILRIIHGDRDPLLEKKKQFIQHYIRPKNGKTASQNIVNDLLSSFGLCKN